MRFDKTYRCNICKTIADEWDLTRKHNEPFNDCCYCPNCGSGDLTEVGQCDVCDEYDDEDAMHYMSDITLCSCCYDNIKFGVDEAVDNLHKYFAEKLKIKAHKETITLAMYDILEKM